MKKFLHFISYHNAFPLAFGVIFLSFGAALAASPDVREEIIGSSRIIRSVDNSYLLALDLSSYTPKVEIINVTEDSGSYYLEYSFLTIEPVNGVWRDVLVRKTLTVAKAVLGRGDLGVYATRELAEVIDAELYRLRETKAIEQAKGVTEQTVATEYSGLIGRFLDDKVETLPGYVPVKTEPVAPSSFPSQSVATESSPQSQDMSVPVSQGGDTTPPSLTVLGNNPARIPLRSSYVDLGALVTDNLNSNLGISYAVDGITMADVNIDTSAVGEHTVTYTATDQAGNVGTAERSVIVYDPYVVPPSGEESSPASVASTTEDIP